MHFEETEINGVKVLSLILTAVQNYKAVSCTKRPCDCYDRAM